MSVRLTRQQLRRTFADSTGIVTAQVSAWSETWGGVEGLGQSGLGGVNLLIDELAADLVFPRPVRDGLSPGEHLGQPDPAVLGGRSLWAGQ